MGIPILISRSGFTSWAVEIARKNVNVEVLRDNYRRWLLVDLSPSDVWTLSKEFFRSYGFTIEKENYSLFTITNFIICNFYVLLNNILMVLQARLKL